jgi:cytochrome P450
LIFFKFYKIKCINKIIDEFTDWQMLMAITDLFGAGLVTTVTTLRFAINYLLVHPDVQAKIHAEIDASIGRDREISMDDQKLLPYLCAYIQVTDIFGKKNIITIYNRNNL